MPYTPGAGPGRAAGLGGGPLAGRPVGCPEGRDGGAFTSSSANASYLWEGKYK